MESAFFRTDGVAAVRYPKDCEKITFGVEDTDSFIITKNGSRQLAVSCGRIVHELYAAAESVKCDVMKLVKIYPIDKQVIELCMNYDEIYFFEECSRRGGAAEHLLTELYKNGYRGKFSITAVDGFVKQASLSECLDEYGLSKAKMIKILNNCAEDSIET